MKVAFIGCGAISEYHAQVLKELGCVIDAVCSRPGSSRPQQFADRFGAARVYDGPSALLEAGRQWDALVIAVPPHATVPILTRAVTMGVPILVEKPAASRSSELNPLLGKGFPVIVGYNRRFYAPVLQIRSLVQASLRPFQVHCVIPETVAREGNTRRTSLLRERFIGNSVHATDLIHYLFGPMDLVHVEPVLGGKGESEGFSAMLRSRDRKAGVTITAAWNTPANFSLHLYQEDLRIRLEPFERGAVFRELRRIEPTPAHPVRRYVPVAARRLALDEADVRFKPGFYRQALALIDLVRGTQSEVAATLEDAYRAIKLSEELLQHLAGDREPLDEQ